VSDRAPEPTRLEVLGRDSRRDGRTETHQLSLRVPAELRWLRGHFDGYPILPAVVQLLEVERHLRQIWSDLAVPRRVTRAKFRRPIRPEDRLLLRLERTDGRRQAGFTYLREGEVCSSGTMAFEPPEVTPGE
jgi:3-hydroxymyristoyl/3-hydroxydecanoyl-(acyl carrier protein) dehydratase